MKVLLVDDDRDQLAVRQMLLEQFGFQIEIASSESAALRMAAIQRPACALIDLRMPTEEVGLRMIRKLKQLRADMRILVLTGGKKDRLEKLPERALIDTILEKGLPAANLVEELQGKKSLRLGDLHSRLKEEGVLTLDLKVVPRSSSSEVAGLVSGGALKVRVAAVPEKGKANDELCSILADYFHVRLSDVELLMGETSRNKRVQIRRR